MMFTPRSMISVGVVSFCLAGPVTALFATPINYGNLNAANVVYQQITEDSSTDPTPLFGAPSIAGDAITFSPVSFGASATGAGGIDLTDGTLATSIVANQGSAIETLQFAERGDWTLFGNGTANTMASVTCSIFVRITQTEHGSINPVSFTANMTFTPANGSYNLIDNRGSGLIWAGAANVDITGALLAAGFSDKAKKVDITLDNTLLAVSEAGTVAYIKKKQQEGLTITTVVPEPSVVSLLLLGGLFLAKRK